MESKTVIEKILSAEEEREMYCRKCGKKYPKEYRFCETCGGELEDELNVFGEKFYAGEEGAFEAIYGESEKWVRAYVYHRVSAADVEDCMQNIYVKLYEKINLFDKKKASFRVWFNVLLKNETTDFVRKYSSQQGKDEFLFVGEEGEDIDLGLESTDESPDIVMDKAETTRLIREILGGISEEQRVCIMLYYLEGKKQNEITEELCISAGTVKSRLHYGKEKVKEEVLKLEKQGTKLYGFAPFPFFIWLLRSEDALAASAAASAAATPMNLETARAATKAAGVAAGKTVTAKIVTGIVIAGLLGGGGYAAYKHFAGQPQMMPTIDDSAKGEADDMQALAGKIDYDYLMDLLWFLPVDQKTSELSAEYMRDDVLYKAFFLQAEEVRGQFQEREGSQNNENDDVCYDPPMILSSEDVLSYNDKNIVFSGNCVEKIQSIIGVDYKPKAYVSNRLKYIDGNYEGSFIGDKGYLLTRNVYDNTVILEDKIFVNFTENEKDLNYPNDLPAATKKYAVIVSAENQWGYQLDGVYEGTITPEGEMGQDNAGIDKLEKTIDYNELQNALTYLPCYESVDELTDDTYSDIFLRGTIYRYLQTSTGTNIEQIIPDNEVLSINSQNSDVGYNSGSNIILKASAFDRFIDLLNSRVKPQEIISEAWPSQMYRFKNNQYEADMDGLGGVSSYSVVLRNTVIGEDNIAVNYYYKEEIAGNITEEERHAVLMKSEMGYCIGQIRSGTVQEEAASKEEDIVSDNEELYADIITAYRNLYEGITEEEPLISEISLWEVRKDVALQYAFYDIDGNGVDECLFSQEAEGIAQGDAWVKNDKSYFGIWTWEDETAVLVKPEQVGRLYGNPMTLLTICEDGIIRCYDYIGSRDEMWDFYKMNGSSLKSVNSYSRQNNWDGMIAEFPQGQILLDDEENQITEEQVDRVNESYPEIRDTIQWENL